MTTKTKTTKLETGEPVLVLDGLRVTLYRCEYTGLLSVMIDSYDVKARDTHDDTGVPKLQLMVNEATERLDREGGWERQA